jgi:LysM repeat protein
MAAIAAKHGIEPARLMKVNPQVKDPDRLVPGQKIMLP